ncbi:MAG: Ig-like domain-containing protein [Gammaproteobacteria bacterium]
MKKGFVQSGKFGVLLRLSSLMLLTLLTSGCSLQYPVGYPMACFDGDIVIAKSECQPIDDWIDSVCPGLAWNNGTPNNRSFTIDPNPGFDLRLSGNTTYLCANANAQSGTLDFFGSSYLFTSSGDLNIDDGLPDYFLNHGLGTIHVGVIDRDLPSSNLQITQAITPDPVHISDDVTFHITITNLSEFAIDKIALTDWLPVSPSNGNPVSVKQLAISDGMLCSPQPYESGERLECTFTDQLDRNESIDFAITVQALAAGDLCNKVLVEAQDASGLHPNYATQAPHNQSTVCAHVTETPPPPLAANDDYFEVAEDAELQTDSSNSILANDTGAPVSWMVTKPPVHAISDSYDLVAGTFYYKPEPNYFGTDSFSYKVRDVNGNFSNEATVHIDVKPVNDPPTMHALPPLLSFVSPGGTYSVSLSGINMGQANENDMLTIAAVSGNPDVVLNPNVTYTSPNATGELTLSLNGVGQTDITVTLSDGTDSVSQTFKVTIGLSEVSAFASPSEAYENTGQTASIYIQRLGESIAFDQTIAFEISGTAENGVDYTIDPPVFNTVTIPAGSSFVELVITPINDNIPESDETLVLKLLSGNDYFVSDFNNIATVTITDTAP